MNAQTEVRAAKLTHKNVYCALAAAQMEMDPLTKGALNPAFKGEGKPKGTAYADLADVVQAVRGALNSHGLAFFHQLIPGDSHIMRTVLVHGDSESRIECDVPLIVSKNDMQGMKSATTYAKRIGLESVTGVAPEDDDGNAAVVAAPAKQAPKADMSNESRRDWFLATMAKADTRDKLRNWWTGEKIAAAHAALPEPMRDELTAEYNRLFDAMSPAANADLAGDSLPY